MIDLTAAAIIAALILFAAWGTGYVMGARAQRDRDRS